MPAKKAAAKRSARAKAAARKPARKAAKAKPQQAVADQADGTMPVQAYLATLPHWQKAILQEVDAIIEREVPGVRKAIKWHAPIYGTDRNGWFAALSAHSKHVKLVFFQGRKLKPALPAGQGKQMRSMDLREGDALQTEVVASYVRQASALRGMGAAA